MDEEVRPQLSLEDQIYREVWRIGLSITDPARRIYELAWLLNRMPPENRSLRKECIVYLFDQVDRLDPAEAPKALMHLLWKLPTVDEDMGGEAFNQMGTEYGGAVDLDPEKAVKMFERVRDKYGFELFGGESVVSLAAEEWAPICPQVAMVMALSVVNYYPVLSAYCKIIKALCREDLEMAINLTESAREIIQNFDDPFGKVLYFIDLCEAIADGSPKTVRKILAQAEPWVDGIVSLPRRADALNRLLKVACMTASKEAARLCNKANKLAIRLSDPATAMSFDRSGPYVAARALVDTSAAYAVVDNKVALQILNRALELACERGDPWDHFELLTAFASAIKEGKLKDTNDIASRLWGLWEPCMQYCVNLKDPSLFATPAALRIGLKDSIRAFISMDARLAEQKIDSILNICAAANLPEQQIKLMATYAVQLATVGASAPAIELIRRAIMLVDDCSSAYLRTLSLAHINAALFACRGFNDAIWERMVEQFKKLPSETRFEAMVDAVRVIAEVEPDGARHLFDSLNEETLIEPELAVGKLVYIPVQASGETMLMCLRSIDSMPSLCTFSDEYAKVNHTDRLH